MTDNPGNLLVFLFTLFAVFGGIITYLDKIHRDKEWKLELAKPAVTDEGSYVPGGIYTTEPERLRRFFESQATRMYLDDNPYVDANDVHVEQIGPIVYGSVSGTGDVDHLGEDYLVTRKIDTPLEAYRVTYRFPDGAEKTMHYLMGGMNWVDCSENGFTFIAEREVSTAT